MIIEIKTDDVIKILNLLTTIPTPILLLLSFTIIVLVYLQKKDK